MTAMGSHAAAMKALPCPSRWRIMPATNRIASRHKRRVRKAYQEESRFMWISAASLLLAHGLRPAAPLAEPEPDGHASHGVAMMHRCRMAFRPRCFAANDLRPEQAAGLPGKREPQRHPASSANRDGPRAGP
jgi:hypothetical protein